MREMHAFAIAVFFFFLVLIFPTLPIWLAISAALVTLIRILFLRRGEGSPPRILITAVGITALSLAMLEAPQFWHKDTITATVTIVSLMVLWDRPNRHQVMLIHGSFFALLLCLLVAPGNPLPVFIYFLLTIMIFFSLALHHLPPKSLFSLAPLSRNSLKIALPVSAILLPIYFFFPEIQRHPRDTAITGLSEYLAPGKVSSLAQSQRLAFRVRFHNPISEKFDNALYWRVAVLQESYGMIWRRGSVNQDEAASIRHENPNTYYDLLPESRLRGNLPLLEHTVHINSLRDQQNNIFSQSDTRSFQSNESLLVVAAHLSDSFQANQPPSIPEPQFSSSARVNKLVKQLQGMTVQDRINHLLQLFAGFRYSLQPGQLTATDQLDEFIFEKRLGFCEHFAAAFASLLQLAGTPARVVTGFAGGSHLGSTGFLVVLDADAHAWAEVWIDGKWLRVDPSAAVPGARIQDQSRNILSFLPAAWISYWSRVVSDKIAHMAQNIELLWFIIAGLSFILLIVHLLRSRNRIKLSPWQQEFHRLLRQLRRAGYRQNKSETVYHFMMRISLEFPRSAPQIQNLIKLYNSSVYGPDSCVIQEETLKILLQELRQQLRRPNAP